MITLSSETFDVTKLAPIPSTPAQGKWHGINLLRQYLQQVGRLNEALFLFDTENGFLPDEAAQIDALVSIRLACQRARDLGSRQPLAYIECSVAFRLAHIYSEMGKEKECIEECEQVEASFLKSAALPNVFRTELRMVRLSLCTLSAVSASGKDWEALADYAFSVSDFRVGTDAIKKAINCLEESSVGQRDNALQEKLLSLCQRLDSLYERLGTAVHRLIARGSFDNNATSAGNYGQILNWHDNFHKSYPQFQCWRLRLSFISRNTHIATFLRDERQIFRIASLANQMVTQRDRFWKDKESSIDYVPDKARHDLTTLSLPIHGNLSTIPAHPNEPVTEIISGCLQSQNWIKIVSNNWMEATRSDAYVRLGTNQIVVGEEPSVFAALLQRMKESFDLQELSPGDFGEIFGLLPECITMHKVQEMLQTLTGSELAATLYGGPQNPRSRDSWKKAFDRLSSWLRTSTRYTTTENQGLLARLQLRRASSLSLSWEDQISEHHRVLELAATLNFETQNLLRRSSPHVRNVIGIAKVLQSSVSHEVLLSPETQQRLNEAGELYDMSMKECLDHGNDPGAASTAVLIGQLAIAKLLAGQKIDVDMVLNHLQTADALFRSSRSSFRAFDPVRAIETAISFNNGNPQSNLHFVALTILCRLQDFPARQQCIWHWVQLAKSQGLTALAEASSNIKKEILEAVPFTTQDVQYISESVGGKIVFIDWYDNVQPGSHTSPILVVIQAGGTPQYYPLDIRWDTVSEQARRLYEADGNGLNTRSSASALQNLSALIGPVAAISKPGDTLVLSPAGVMHSIPMHALLVDGQPLIERNPIVYTSSMALLKNAFEAGQDLAATLSSGQLKWKAAVFDGNPPTSAGKEALSAVSDQLRAEAFLSERSTTAAFRATISQISFLHYHGHAVFEHNEPWEHCLQLSAGELKARDLLEASPLGNSYHATVLGCGSGKLSITQSEVLGLVPAFIYSGALSTISTL